jgi:hypothetical protein
MKNTQYERKLYIPTKVNLTELILSKHNEEYRQHHQDKYAYFLSKIIELKIFATPKRNGFVSLHAETLRDVLGGGYYMKVKNDLLDWGVIITDNHYEKGKYSKGFNIAPAYQSKALEIMILKEQFAAKMKRQHHQNSTKPDSYILSQLKYIQIRHLEALQYIEDKCYHTLMLIDSLSSDMPYNEFKGAVARYPELDFYTIKNEDDYDLSLLNEVEVLKGIVIEKHNADFAAIHNIKDRDFSFSVDINTGRVYTFITNLSKPLRQFLYHKKYPDTPFVNIDIRNSQPFIFCSLLMTYYKYQLPEDVQEYIQLCSNGMLYNVLMAEMNYQGDRKSFKQLLFSTLFYCRNGWADRSKDSEYFRERFPNVYDAIKSYKMDDYKALSRAMQTTEADIMVGRVVKNLMRGSVFLTTVHDSIITFAHNADLVMDTIKYYFHKEYSLIPSLDAEALNPVPAGSALLV